MPRTMTIACPACKAPAEASIERVIDVKRRPQLRAALLSGQLNRVSCAACGSAGAFPTPLLYHDADNELLIAFVPPELNFSGPQRDQVVGDMLRELTSSIPRDEFRGYMFQPKQALTMQGLVEQVMAGDDVSRDEMEQQRSRFRLLEQLAQAEPKRLRALVRQHDETIDAAFFQAALVMTRQAAREGQEQLVNSLAAVQEAAARHSSFGRRLTAEAEARERIVAAVAKRIQALGERPQRRDLLELALELAQDEEQLQALVGLLRPALDYPFFQELTLRIGQASGPQRASLEALRDRLGELTRMADAQSQAALRRAAATLQAIMDSGNTERAVREHAAQIDANLMALLAANIQEAERRADVQASSRLKDIQQKILSLLQKNMRPELRFVNELLATRSRQEALARLDEGLTRFGRSLPQAMTAVADMLRQQGQDELARRLDSLRASALEKLKD